LQKVTTERIAFLEELIHARNEKGREEAEKLIVKKGRGYTQQIRTMIAGLMQEEERLLEERNKADDENEAAFDRSFYLLLANSVVFLIFGIVVFRRNILFRRKAKEELFLQNEWYNQTLISLGDGVITTDANGVITFLNKAAEELVGWKTEEAVGKHIDHVFEITNEASGRKVTNPLMQAIHSNKIVWLANHTMLKRKDGTKLFIDDSGAPIHDIDGKITGGVLIFRDITEKKKAGDELEAANRRFATIFNFSPVSIAITTIEEGRFLYVNDAFCEITGYKKEDIIGKNSVDVEITEPNLRERLITQLQKEGGHGENIETRIKKADGKIIEILYSAEPIDIDNTFCYVYAMVDITQRKKIEREIKYLNESLEKRVDERTSELSKSEKKYKNLFENNPQPMWVYNIATLRFLNVNEAAIQHYGYTRSEFLSMTLKEVRPFEDVEPLLRDISLPSGKLSQAGVWRHKKKNGDVIFVEINSHQFNYEGTDARLVLINDITERKKAEDELVRKNIQLQKTNTELDRFVYSTSHDLRAPLTSLLGLISITDENISSKDSEQKERMAMMKRTVTRLDEFIAEILDYSRNTRTRVAHEPIDFESEIKKVRETLKYMEGTSGYRLKVEVNQAGNFISDRRRIGVILNNLMANAIKYQDTSKENSFVRVTIQSDDEKATIVVEDNGIGIAEKDHGKIFEMFYRASKLSTGSGLGLYIVKETLDNLKGTIEMESELEKGSKFTITMPNLEKHA
jgi:PAS domain S-box-containing protein